MVKIATNAATAERMSDIIDFDAGPIVTGEKTIASAAAELFELALSVAGGERLSKAELNGQIDFIPWRRGLSL